MHLRSSKRNKTMLRIYGKFSSKSSIGKTKALRECREWFLHEFVWHLSVQPCEKPLYNGINTNWRWKRWMHSSKTTKAKRVKFNRIECGMEFVSVIRLATCECVRCVCEQLLFVHKYIYFSPITATRTHAHDIWESYTIEMRRTNRQTRKNEDTTSLSRAIESVRIYIMSNQSTVFLFVFVVVFIVSFLTA